MKLFTKLFAVLAAGTLLPLTAGAGAAASQSVPSRSAAPRPVAAQSAAPEPVALKTAPYVDVTQEKPTLPEIAEDVSDIIGIVSPHETPLLDLLGDAKRPAISTTHEWLEDALVSRLTNAD